MTLKWPWYSVPDRYVKQYVFLIIGVLWIVPVVFNRHYTAFGYIVNFMWADWLFMKWCQIQIRKQDEKDRLNKLRHLKGDWDNDE